MALTARFAELAQSYEALQLALKNQQEILEPLRTIKAIVFRLNAETQDVDVEQNRLLRRMSRTLPPLFSDAECKHEFKLSQELTALTRLDRSVIEEIPALGATRYKALVSAELDLLGCNNSPRGLIHLGCGPLPLTLIFMAYAKPELKLTGIDQDKSARTQAQKLIDRLGLNDQIEVKHTTALEAEIPAGHIPMLASLLSNKPAVYESLKQQGVSQFLVRDAVGIGKIIYAPAEVPSKPWREVNSTARSTSRINITRHYQKF